MAGGAAKYRHLSRKSSHRQALLRNLVTSLFKHESITTTWPKAKEAQRLAEKLITLGKKNSEASRRRALSVFYVCWIPVILSSNSTFAYVLCEPIFGRTFGANEETSHDNFPP
jgi:ribosomal protein L17